MGERVSTHRSRRHHVVPDWMGSIIHSYTPLSEITIPGTHDSAATIDGVAPRAAAAQTPSIIAQLNDGVRFLDLRLREGAAIDFFDPLVPAHGPVVVPGSVGKIFGEISDSSAHIRTR